MLFGAAHRVRCVRGAAGGRCVRLHFINDAGPIDESRTVNENGDTEMFAECKSEVHHPLISEIWIYH